MSWTKRIDDVVSEQHLLKHPFYTAWTEGRLTRAALSGYAAQYYKHVAAFPRYLSAIHSQTPDLETRQYLLENLIDEERCAENHPELWLKVAQALGLNREKVLSAEPLPAANALVETFDHLSRDFPLPAGLSAVYVYESQVAEVANAKIAGLQRFYGFPDDANADGMKFFAIHRNDDLSCPGGRPANRAP